MHAACVSVLARCSSCICIIHLIADLQKSPYTSWVTVHLEQGVMASQRCVSVQVINAVVVVFVWFTMVETKQRSLAQIQAQLVGTS